jgi:hypothetical protein
MASRRPLLAAPLDADDLDLKICLYMKDQQEAGPGKRKRGEELPASSVMLKSFSEKFKQWLTNWATGGQPLAVEIEDEGDVETWRRLLAFIRQLLPAGAPPPQEYAPAAQQHRD